MSSKLSLSVPFYWSSQRPRCISLPVLLLLAACLPALKKSTSQNIPWNIPNDYPVIPLYPNDIPIVGYFTRKLQQKAFDCSLAAEGPAIDRIQFGRWSPWKDPPSPWKRFHWKTKKKRWWWQSSKLSGSEGGPLEVVQLCSCLFILIKHDATQVGFPAASG